MKQLLCFRAEVVAHTPQSKRPILSRMSDAGATKTKRARELGTEIIDEAEFLRRLS